MWNPFARGVERRQLQREWFARFADQLEGFVRALPEGLDVEWERRAHYLNLTIAPPSPAHRRLDIEAGPGGLDYALGKVWGEGYAPTEDVGNRVLAACDAVEAGRVREVRDRDTGMLYHLYRLTTRGCDEFMWDSQYSFLPKLRKKIRNVQITRLAPLRVPV